MSAATADPAAAAAGTACPIADLSAPAPAVVDAAGSSRRRWWGSGSFAGWRWRRTAEIVVVAAPSTSPRTVFVVEDPFASWSGLPRSPRRRTTAAPAAASASPAAGAAEHIWRRRPAVSAPDRRRRAPDERRTRLGDDGRRRSAAARRAGCRVPAETPAAVDRPPVALSPAAQLVGNSPARADVVGQVPAASDAPGLDAASVPGGLDTRGGALYVGRGRS